MADHTTNLQLKSEFNGNGNDESGNGNTLVLGGSGGSFDAGGFVDFPAAETAHLTIAEASITGMNFTDDFAFQYVFELDAGISTLVSLALTDKWKGTGNNRAYQATIRNLGGNDVLTIQLSDFGTDTNTYDIDLGKVLSTGTKYRILWSRNKTAGTIDAWLDDVQLTQVTGVITGTIHVAGTYGIGFFSDNNPSAMMQGKVYDIAAWSTTKDNTDAAELWDNTTKTAADYDDYATGGFGGSATAPSAFVIGNWSVSDLVTGGDIRIAISALPSDGGSAITDIEYQLDGGSWISLSGTATGNYDISGLTDDQEYDVKIRAVNAEGNGADSDEKAVTPTAAATAPAAFIAGNWTLTDPNTDGDLRIVISTLPDDGGSSITDLEYQLDGGSWVSLSATTTGTYDVAGLTNDQEYDVKIRAVNSVGDGADSDEKSATPTAPVTTSVTPLAANDKIHGLDKSDTSNSTAGEFKQFSPQDVQALVPIAEPVLATDSGLIWMAASSGTKDGTAYVAGDVLLTIDSGGTSKTIIIGDFSAM